MKATTAQHKTAIAGIAGHTASRKHVYMLYNHDRFYRQSLQLARVSYTDQGLHTVDDEKTFEPPQGTLHA